MFCFADAIDWQMWSAFGACISAVSSLFYFLVFVGAVVLAYRQVKEMRTQRGLEMTAKILNDVRDRGRLNSTFYQCFCEGQHLTVIYQHRDEVVNVIRSLSNIGVLLKEKVLSVDSAALQLISDYCFRCWLVIEDYISAERDRRRDPSWQIGVERLAFVCLVIYLGNNDSLTFYSDKPAVDHKVYSNNDLVRKLEQLGGELVMCGELTQRELNRWLFRVVRRSSRGRSSDNKRRAAILKGMVKMARVAARFTAYRLVLIQLRHRSSKFGILKEALNTGQDILMLTVMSKNTFDSLPQIPDEYNGHWRILTWGPEADIVTEAYRKHLNENEDNPNAAPQQLQEALLGWQRFRTMNPRVDIRIRKYNSIPTLQGVFVGMNGGDPHCTIELLPFSTSPSDRLAMLISRKRDPELFLQFYGACDELWKRSEEV